MCHIIAIKRCGPYPSPRGPLLCLYDYSKRSDTNQPVIKPLLSRSVLEQKNVNMCREGGLQKQVWEPLMSIKCVFCKVSEPGYKKKSKQGCLVEHLCSASGHQWKKDSLKWISFLYYWNDKAGHANSLNWFSYRTPAGGNSISLWGFVPLSSLN